MPIAWSFWPGQCAPMTIPLPARNVERLLWRPSITYPPRLIVKCCPVSIQPLTSMWSFWIDRASAYASDCE